MSGRSILIVEDDHGAADAFRPMLSARGYDVRCATDAEAGLREIERSQPAALVVDLHLPVIDGLEFLRLVRNNDLCKGIPAAMMTGDYLLDDHVTGELERLGTPLYFKPLWEEDLVEMVVRLLNPSNCSATVETVCPSSR
jgi:two-component system cell cycle response regulator DivK